MPDDKPPARGPIPYGIHVKTKTGPALITDFFLCDPLAASVCKVLYGIQDNRRFEERILLCDIEEWYDKGVT